MDNCLRAVVQAAALDDLQTLAEATYTLMVRGIDAHMLREVTVIERGQDGIVLCIHGMVDISARGGMQAMPGHIL